MAKNRVLVFTDCYFPVQTANSIIGHNIIDELIKRGYDVTCIAINQDVISPINNKYGYRIYNVENTKYAKLLKDQQQGILDRIKKGIFMFYSINRKFKNILNVLKFPDVDPEQSDKAFKIAKNLHDENPYNFAIGIFRPYSGVSAVLK